MNLSLIKQPSALVPIGLSLLALAVLGGYVALYGTQRQEDEGAAAHLWQLLILAHGPAILVFLGKWAIREPMQTAIVFAIQITALVAALAPVLLLGF